MTAPKKPAPRRAIKCGTRIWVRLTRVEFNMLGLDEQIPMSDFDDSGDHVEIAGTAILAEPHYNSMHIAVGNHVLRLPWGRYLRVPRAPQGPALSR